MWRNHGDVFQGEKKDDLLCARGTSIPQGWAVIIVPGLRILERNLQPHGAHGHVSLSVVLELITLRLKSDSTATRFLLVVPKP